MENYQELFGIEEENLAPSWKDLLSPAFESLDFHELTKFLIQERKRGKIIYPNEQDIFQAFQKTPFARVKVVIIGQDPYHGPGQAHGMSFSVKPQVKIPPSLRNIYKEIHRDLGASIPNHGYLENWAKQGVLLLNTVLTVEAGKAGSHRKKGWETFTDEVIKSLNDHKSHLVFLLWGSPAQKKESLLDSNKHCILKAPHPSPLSAHRGFLGCGHFSQCNNYLESKDLSPINWEIPNQ